MKQRHITTFFINCLLVFSITLSAQNDSISAIEKNDKLKDSTVVKKNNKYGIRFGTDVVKLARTALQDSYSGFELIADYRITKKWYVAGELGNETRDFETDYLDITTKGSYFKAGADYNLHNNLISLDNMIYSGFRVGFSNFQQIINNSTAYTIFQYWSPTPVNTNERVFKNLNAIWLEVQMGIKAEVLTNLYLGVNVQLKYLVSQNEPENFANLYIPGFNKIFEDSKIGTGISYGISYRIPVYKK